MKHRWLLAVVAALMMVSLAAGMVGAAERSPYDMWKGEFVRSNPSTLDAGGVAKINYVKGQQAYMVDVAAYGLSPDLNYEAWLMTTSGYAYPSANHVLLGTLTVDEEGFASLHLNKVAGLADYLDNTNIRVVIYRTPRNSGSWVLSTSLAVNDGDFQPVGSARGE